MTIRIKTLKAEQAAAIKAIKADCKKLGATHIRISLLHRADGLTLQVTFLHRLNGVRAVAPDL